jgi:hypothetical protein
MDLNIQVLDREEVDWLRWMQASVFPPGDINRALKPPDENLHE